MAEKEYIERRALMEDARHDKAIMANLAGIADIANLINDQPTADVVEVVRCQDCIHAVPFDRNCELNTYAYLHCGLLRGEEVNYVWHKYKKYYKGYSVVDRDGFCDSGAKMDGKGEGE